MSIVPYDADSRVSLKSINGTEFFLHVQVNIEPFTFALIVRTVVEFEITVPPQKRKRALEKEETRSPWQSHLLFDFCFSLFWFGGSI